MPQGFIMIMRDAFDGVVYMGLARLAILGRDIYDTLCRSFQHRLLLLQKPHVI